MRTFAKVLAALVLVAGCGDDDGGNGGGGDVTEVNGIVSTNDGLASGSLFVEVQSSSLVRAVRTASAVAASRAPVAASGDVTLFGSTTDLSGTYDPETGVLALEGGGYVFGGLYDGETVTGTWTGPGGTAGSFIAASGQGESFCGTFLVFTEEPPEEGSFSFVVVGEAAYGQAVSESGDVVPLVGELTGPLAATAVNIAFFLPGTTTGFASGQINTTSTSGNFNVPDGEGGFESGSWTGSPAFCDGQT
jgi:hypothetical protein